jgi:hypothetical protein
MRVYTPQQANWTPMNGRVEFEAAASSALASLERSTL